MGVWQFIQDQVLGMKWLNELIGEGLSLLDRGNPKFCVNTICGANRAKFIQGGSRENPAAAFSTT